MDLTYTGPQEAALRVYPPAENPNPFEEGHITYHNIEYGLTELILAQDGEWKFLFFFDVYAPTSIRNSSVTLSEVESF